MKRPFKKAAAFITALVTALTVNAIPASAAETGAPKISTAVSPKYEVAISLNESVVFANTDVNKKNAQMVVVGENGKPVKKKNSLGFAKIIDDVDYSNNTYYNDTFEKGGIVETYQKPTVVETKKGKRYVLLDNGKFMEYTNDIYCWPTYIEKTGKNSTTILDYNGEKIISFKDDRYGVLSSVQYGYAVFCNDSKGYENRTYSIAYGGKIVKKLKLTKGDVGIIYGIDGAYIYNTETGTCYNSKGKKVKAPWNKLCMEDKCGFSHSPWESNGKTFIDYPHTCEVWDREYSECQFKHFKFEYSEETHILSVTNTLTNKTTSTKNKVYLAEDRHGHFMFKVLGNNIGIVTTDKTGKKYGMIVVK